MKLFLASEAKHHDSISELKKLVGGFEAKSLVYIPTAANGEGWESWKEGGSWKLLPTLGAQVTLLELEHATEEEAMEKLSGKDIIWFGGGQCGYLMYWIRRRKIDAYLRKLLDEGSVYVGSSAGAMIVGSSADMSVWYPGENEFGAQYIPWLNLVDFDIFPHYDEQMLDVVQQNFKGKKLYLLKNGEEVIVDGDAVCVVGEERLIIP